MSDRAAESETAILTQFLNLDNIQTFKTLNVGTCGVDGGPSIPTNCHKLKRFRITKDIITGILRDKTMADKLLYIPNDDKQNYPFCYIL